MLNSPFSALGRKPPPSSANTSFLQHDRADQTASIISILRTPMPLTATPMLGVPEIQRAFAIQQAQLDGLVDKIASVLSSMHTDFHQEMRSFLQDVGNAKTLELQLKQVEHEAHRHQNDLGEAQNQIRWLEGRVEALSGRIAMDFDGLQLHLSRDACGIHERISAIESEVYESEGNAMPKWQRAIDQISEEFRKELQITLLDRHFEDRIIALEQHNEHRHEALHGSHVVDKFKRQHQHLESGVRRQAAAMELLLADVQQLHQASAVHEDFQSSQAEINNRIQHLEESLRGGVMTTSQTKAIIDPLSFQSSILEQRLGTVQKRMEEMSATLQDMANNRESVDKTLQATGSRCKDIEISIQKQETAVHSHVQQVLGDLSIERRLEEMHSQVTEEMHAQVDALAASFIKHESRNARAHINHLDDMCADFRAEPEDLRQRPPLPESHSDNYRAGALGSIKNQHRSRSRDSSGKVVEELSMKLELVAKSLEAIDDLMHRVDGLENSLSNLAALQHDGTKALHSPHMNAKTSDSSRNDHVLIEVNSLVVRMSAVELSLQSVKRAEAKTALPGVDDNISIELNNLVARMSAAELSLESLRDICTHGLSPSRESLRAVAAAPAVGVAGATSGAAAKESLLSQRITDLETAAAQRDAAQRAVLDEAAERENALRERIQEVEKALCNGVDRSLILDVTRDSLFDPSGKQSPSDFFALEERVCEMERGLGRVTEEASQARVRVDHEFCQVFQRLDAFQSELLAMEKPGAASPRFEAFERRMQLLVEEKVKHLRVSPDQVQQTPKGSNASRFATPRLEALEKRMESLVEEQVFGLKADLDQAQQTSKTSNLAQFATPRLEALENRMQGLVEEQVLNLKADLDQAQQTSKDWIRTLTKHTELAVGTLQQQLARAMNGGASPSVLTSSRRSGSASSRRSRSAQSRSRSRSNSCARGEDIQSSDLRGRAMSSERSRIHGQDDEQRSQSSSRERVRRQLSTSEVHSDSREGSQASQSSRSRSRSLSSLKSAQSLSAPEGNNEPCKMSRSASERQDSGVEEVSIGGASATVALQSLQAVEEKVAKLWQDLACSPSRCAPTAEEVQEKADRILGPVATAENMALSAEQPTTELRARVESLLRGKLVVRMLLKRSRSLEPASDALTLRLQETVQELKALRRQFQTCLEQAMGELKKQVDELMPLTSEEEDGVWTDR